MIIYRYIIIISKQKLLHLQTIDHQLINKTLNFKLCLNFDTRYMYGAIIFWTLTQYICMVQLFCELDTRYMHGAIIFYTVSSISDNLAYWIGY